MGKKFYIMSDSKDEKEQVEDCSNSDVLTKYRKAGEIANAALNHVLTLLKPDAKVVDVCSAGDSYITDETSKLYKKGKVEGHWFPNLRLDQ